ncbi:MAG: phosphoenolpyruvate--protein phosphotransferase, partial [Deltaproteobacteria bacterium]|nr:phosphoenolpyruvate--protein phosphotransferase [Deltaproteobacteria bacterium]
MTTGPATGERELRGVAVYPDIVIGKAHLIDRSSVKIQYQCFVHDEDVDREVARFKEAVKTVEKEFTSLKENMPDRVRDQSFILDSHLMILRDGMLYDSTIEAISEERINAEWALKKSLEEIGEIFEEIDDEYISNRISDVENVTDRLLRTLSGDTGHSLGEINQRVIIVAHDLSPADTTELNTAWVMGFITDVGGKTSHTAIMAQALEIPAVVGLETATSLVKDGDLLIVDGSAGVVVINPDDRAIIHYQEKKLQLQAYRSSIARTSHLPAETPDGHRVAITANIEFLEEVTAAKDYGGEGIGLYRTEFLYLRGRGFPDEEELFEDYREVVEIMSPAPVSIRTLDLGGDKFASEVAISGESNPALGLRAIRFCLREPEIFKVQLRAILRASAYGNIQLMFPMISGLQELIDAKEILGQVQEEL